jgi:tetratricopeptide (TPR) repeat protein
LINAVLPRASWVFARRAACFAALGEAGKAREDLLAALEVRPSDLNSLPEILPLAASLGDWELVLRATRDLPPYCPEYCPDYWRPVAFRVRAAAERRDWDRALDDLSRLAEVTPDDNLLLICQSAIHQLADAGDAAHRAFEEMATRAAAAPVPGDAIPLLDALLSLEGLDVELAPLTIVAERAAAVAPENLRTLGAALYRQGHFGRAVEALDGAARAAPLRPRDHLFLAMAQQRLGRAAAARDHLRLGREPPPAVGIVNFDDTAELLTSWSDRIALADLRREAERIVGE